MKKPTFVIVPASPEEAAAIDMKLAEFNNRQVPFTQEPSLLHQNYLIKDGETIIAGLKADIYYWRILFIEVLFVEEQYRGQGLGSALLKKVEDEARALGTTLAHLDTFDFQAKDFYIKHGYQLFGSLDDCPPGHQRHYLKKRL